MAWIEKNGSRFATLKRSVHILLRAAFSMAVLVATTAACNLIPPTRNGEDYRTPIPDATVAAYPVGETVDSRYEAVIAARRQIGTSRLHCSRTPRAVYADPMRYADAIDQLGKTETESYDTHPDDANVWLVILACDWVVEFDPQAQSTQVSTPTPGPDRCAYAILFDAEGGDIGGIFDCAQWGR